MNGVRLAATCVLIAACAALLACESDPIDDRTTAFTATPPPPTTTVFVPSTTPVATPSPVPYALTPDDRAFVDRVIALQQAGDWPGLDALVGFTLQPCEFRTDQGMQFAPRCHEGEQEGDVVDAFLVAACGAGFGRPDERETFIEGGAGTSLTSRARFHGVISAQADLLDAGYHIVVAYVGSDPDTGFWFTVRDRRIVAQRRSCGSLTNSFGASPVYLIAP